MTKSEINAILKEIGYGSMKMRAGFYETPKCARDRQGKMIKGIWCGDVGPTTVTSPHLTGYENVVREFCKKVGGRVDESLSSYEMKVVAFGGGNLVSFALNSYPYGGDYDRYYATVTIRK